MKPLINSVSYAMEMLQLICFCKEMFHFHGHMFCLGHNHVVYAEKVYRNCYNDQLQRLLTVNGS